MANVASLTSNSAIELLFTDTNISLSFILQLMNPYSLASKALKNPYFSRPSEMILPPWPYCEIPASNGIGTARSVACLWQLVLDKHYLNTTLSKEVLRDLREEPTERPDGVLGQSMRYHLGFTRPSYTMKFGVSEFALGFAGIGGAFSFADPKLGLTYAYTPNRLGPVMWDDPRERALRHTLFQCLADSGIKAE
jgi:CubicO group peptidase (beta-lactamase class C family)